MAYTLNLSPGKVSYFKHFPHYFLRPYDAQILYNGPDFFEKLSSKNCEWMCRPHFALSEAAQAITDNWKIIEGGNFLSNYVEETLQNHLHSIHTHLGNLNQKDKNSTASAQDVFTVMRWCYEGADIDDQIAEWMQKSAATYVLLAQLRAMRACITNPTGYATKLMSDDASALQFKSTKTVAALQNMLTQMSVPAARHNIPSSAVRALASDLVDPSQHCPSTSQATPSSQSGGLVDPSLAMIESSTQFVTSSRAPVENQTGALNNELMDMILSMQAQLSKMQEQSQSSRSQQASEEAVDDDGQPRSIKRKASKQKKPAQANTQPPTAVNLKAVETSYKKTKKHPSTSQSVPIVTLDEPAKKKHKKGSK